MKIEIEGDYAEVSAFFREIANGLQATGIKPSDDASEARDYLKQRLKSRTPPTPPPNLGRIDVDIPVGRIEMVEGEDVGNPGRAVIAPF